VRHRTPKTSSIEKALDILMAFAPANREMGTTELSGKLQYHPATVNRILQILCHKGFLQQNAGSRKFTLGPATFQLGRTLFRSISGNLVDIAMPHLIDLCEKVGETVVLEVLSQNECVVTYMAQGKSSLSIGPRIGDRVPLHAAPGAKVMIAFQEPEAMNRLLKSPLQRFTPKTITKLEALRREIAEARKNGVAFCREEMAEGVNAVGVPVFDHQDRPLAAIVIAGLASRVKCSTRSPLVEELKKTGRDISAHLFHKADLTETGGIR
jgi:DNA-binding IclR family transcriptional regulator